jgi:hypothetical protein
VASDGEQVTLAACLDLGAAVEDFECVESGYVVRLADGAIHTHQADEQGWSVDLGHGDPVILGGLRDLPVEPAMPPERKPTAVLKAPRVAATPAHDGSLGGFVLEAPLTLDREDQFRRAEEPWPGPDGFSARAFLNVSGSTLHLAVEVVAPEPHFRPGDEPDPEVENENPDIHSDGIQMYLDAAGFYGWLVVPDTQSPPALRIAAVRSTDAEASMVTAGAWAPTDTGYRITMSIELAAEVSGFGFDLYVNRGRAGRDRRVGQLVWSGGRGTRLYLAGDRALPGELPLVEVAP